MRFALLVLVAAALVVAVEGTKIATTSPCQKRHDELRALRGQLKTAQIAAAKCADENFACIDTQYGVVQQKRRAIVSLKRQIRKNCAKKTQPSKPKKSSRSCRRHRRALRKHRRALRACESDSCESRHRKAIRKNARALRRCRKGISSNKCTKKAFNSWVQKMRRRRRHFHRRARRCAGNSKCVRRNTMRVLRLSKAITIRRNRCMADRKQNCTSKRFIAWLKSQRRERARLHDTATKCKDEDMVCIRRAMRQILKLNRRIKRRRAKCVFKQAEKFILTSPSINSMFHVISDMTWRRAITCDIMRKNFRLWVKNMGERRAHMHDSACLCSDADSVCIKDRFRRILRIQSQIRQGRSDYIKLVEACDKCEPLRERFARWRLLQQQRRDRLHEEICACSAKDTECVTSRVEKIKLIGQRIKEGRDHIFKMNSHCITPEDEHPLNTTPAPGTARAGSLAPVTATVSVVLLSVLAVVAFF